MRSFPLKIVTPEGVAFDGKAEGVTVLTGSGRLGILANHADLAATLCNGSCAIVTQGQRRGGHCNGGILTVLSGKVTLVARSFVWET